MVVLCVSDITGFSMLCVLCLLLFWAAVMFSWAGLKLTWPARVTLWWFNISVNTQGKSLMGCLFQFWTKHCRLVALYWRSGNRCSVLIERWSLLEISSVKIFCLWLQTGWSFLRDFLSSSCRLNKRQSWFLIRWSSLGWSWLKCSLSCWFEVGEVWETTALIKAGFSTYKSFHFLWFGTQRAGRNKTQRP